MQGFYFLVPTVRSGSGAQYIGAAVTANLPGASHPILGR